MNDLIARFLEDRRSLDEAELTALTRHLEAHPAALAEVRAQLACDDLLARHFDERRAAFVARVKDAAEIEPAAAVVENDFVRAVQQRVGREKAPSIFARRRQWWAAHPRMVWAGAGAVACAVAAMFFLRPAAQPEVRLAETRGDVRVWRAQQTRPVTAGFVLRADDWVLTGEDSAATVEFPGETTRLVLGAKAEFGVVSARPGKQLKLVAGTLTASVARQSASQPMLLRTPTARAEVLGTKFELSASKTATQLRVTEGRVLIAQKDEEAGVVVEAAQTATVTDSPTVEVTTLPLAEQLRAGLLAHWTFDSPDGAHDASGHGHDLQVSADAVWSEGRLGQALDLHAAKAVVETPRLELPPVFTIALWLRLNQGGPARVQPVIGFDGQQAGVDDFFLNVPPTMPGSGLVFDVRGRQMGSRAFAKRGVVFAGRWQHVAVIADSVRGQAAFHVDGREVTAQPGLRQGFKLSGPLLIGRRVKGGPLPFDGQLDDLRIYARALTAAEIAALAEGKTATK